MYFPAGQDVTAVANTVLAVMVQAPVTYCVLLGAAQEAIEHVGLVPALAPEAV